MRDDKDEFRYEMLNRSAACQAAVAHPRILQVIEPLLGDDCHVIANTAWRNPPDFAGGPWHCDAGPHVPRARGRALGRPHPVPDLRGRDAHLPAGLHARRRADRGRARQPPLGPARHRSIAMRADELSYDGRPPVLFEVEAGDVALFVSDVWHRGAARGPGGRGRYFLQVHYARRDIAQRIRTTADVNQVSPEAIGPGDDRAGAQP